MKTWAGKGGEREKRESDEEMECEMELRKHTNDKPTFSFHLRLKGSQKFLCCVPQSIIKVNIFRCSDLKRFHMVSIIMVSF
jgi:hypothetical protein